MTETVSVIIPVYNAGGHLERCLESITEQTHRELDIIVVDDGSTDGSLRIIRAYAARDPRIKVIVQPNLGVSAARNAGLDAACGRYVSFVDADDWLERETFSVIVDCIVKSRSDYVSFGYFVDSHGSVEYPVPARYVGVHEPESGLSLVLETRNRFVWTRLFTRELIGAVRFREDFHWGEDTVFVVQVIKKARSTAAVRDTLYHYVQSDGSATRSRFNLKRLTGIRMTRVLEELVVDGYPQFVANVLGTRVKIFGVLFQDVIANRQSVPAGTLMNLKKGIRGELGSVWRTKGVPIKTRVKATLMAISPVVFVAIYRARMAVRGG